MEHANGNSPRHTDDAWFALPTAQARARALEWSDDPRQPLVLAALDAGRELGRRLIVTMPLREEPDPIEEASRRVFERYPGHLLPDVESTSATWIVSRDPFFSTPPSMSARLRSCSCRRSRART